MAQAIITDGFVADSTSVTVVAEVANATAVLVYDDANKELLGSGTITANVSTVTLSGPLYAGQRIIAYLVTFGDGTYGAVVVTESDTEYTGWKTVTEVDGVPYADYLAAGGAALPEIYDPEGCRNTSRDRDFVSSLLATAISFNLRLIETQAGTIQVIVEDIRHAIGGAIIKFDGDTAGATSSKTYSVNGSYQVKIWAANQIEADAITKEYTLTMPTAVTTFGSDIYDLAYRVDYGNTSSPGNRPIDMMAYTNQAVEFQIDGEVSWTTGTLAYGGSGTREYRLSGQFLAVGTYTIRSRRLSDGGDEISREINLEF